MHVRQALQQTAGHRSLVAVLRGDLHRTALPDRLHVRSVRHSDVEDVVPLEELPVGLDALRAELRELAAVLDEAAGRVEVEHPHRLVAHVPEPVDDVRRGEDVRARSRVDDLVADVELDLAFEDVERVGVPLVEVGVDAASRIERDLEQASSGRSALSGMPSPGARAIGSSMAGV